MGVAKCCGVCYRERMRTATSTPTISKTYASKSRPDHSYTATVNPTTGRLECGPDCKGWLNKREGKPRHCTHTKDLVVTFGLNVEERDGQMFLVGQAPTIRIERGGMDTRLVEPAKVETLRLVGGFVSPMLASKMPDGWDADRYSAATHVMEEKYDGHRIIAAVSGGRVSAWSRLENSRTLPAHIAAQVALLPDGVYDGEIIVANGHSYDVTAGQNAGTEGLVLFDVVEVLGTSVATQPLDTRRAMLEMAFSALDASQTAVSLTVQQAPSMAAVKAIWKRGGEGAIIKARTSRYQAGYRTADWVKVKAVAAATVTIVGFEAGKVGAYSAAKVVDAQGIETTVKTLNNATLRQVAANPAAFIGARLVISYQERTPSGKYRHPMWDHLAGKAE